MSHHQDNSEQENEKPVDITPSENPEAGTGDPGRTPGKAEGEDDGSAEK